MISVISRIYRFNFNLNTSHLAAVAAFSVLSSATLAVPGSKQACNYCHTKLEEVVVTGYRPPTGLGLLYGGYPGYLGSFFIAPVIPPISYNSEELRRQEEEKKRKEREECIDGANTWSKQCRNTYGGTGNYWCYAASALWGGALFTKIPKELQKTFGIGATAGAKGGCDALKEQAQTWCDLQKQSKIANCQ